MTIVNDVNRCVTMDAKQAGNLLVVVGLTKNELGGSRYYQQAGQLGANVPRVDLKTAPQVMAAVAEAIEEEVVKACHDCSEGGLAVALAEMAFAGGLGMQIDLGQVPAGTGVVRDDQLLFSESASRFVIEIEPGDLAKLAKICSKVRFSEIGKVTDTDRFVVRGTSNSMVIDADIAELKEAWQKPLRW